MCNYRTNDQKREQLPKILNSKAQNFTHGYIALCVQEVGVLMRLGREHLGHMWSTQRLGCEQIYARVWPCAQNEEAVSERCEC